MSYKTWDEINQDQKIERWENVLRVLNKMTPHQRKKHFNMSEWASKTDCGTIGCAAGLCSFDPWFVRRGFKSKFKFCKDDIDPKESFWDHDFTEMYPEDFFGYYGYETIFINNEFVHHKGARVHAWVVKAVKAYIKELQDGQR